MSNKKYTIDHEWVSVENGVATFGITNHSQQSLVEIKSIKLPSVGDTIRLKEPLGTIKSVTFTVNLSAPVSGEILEVNDSLHDAKSSLLNQSPEKDGWIAKVKMANPKELEPLMDSTAYEAFCDSLVDK